MAAKVDSALVHLVAGGYPDILVSAPLASSNGISSAGTFHAISGRLPLTITTSTGAAAFSQSTVPAIIDDGITINDANNPTLATAEIWISEAFANGDILGFVEQNAITGQYNSLIGVLTLAGIVSVDAYQTALRSITYQIVRLIFLSARSVSKSVMAQKPVMRLAVQSLLYL